jgi:glycerate kinase
MEFVTNVCNLEDEIKNSEVILTGEGSIDQQTMEGKVVYKIHELCKKYDKPLLIVSGINRLTE